MSDYFGESPPRNRRGDNSFSTTQQAKIPYRSLTYYLGRKIRVFIKENPLLNHPAIYEGVFSGFFENPTAIILEDASILILDRVPMQNHYHISRREHVGAVFIRMDELRYFEVLSETESESPEMP